MKTVSVLCDDGLVHRDQYHDEWRDHEIREYVSYWSSYNTPIPTLCRTASISRRLVTGRGTCLLCLDRELCITQR
jgi:hypothetical protein